MAHIIAIDGPAGAGKGTIAKLIAHNLDYVYIDTGAMYRVVALKCIREDILPSDLDKLSDLLNNLNIELTSNDGLFEAFLDGENVTTEIRTVEVDSAVPKFASIPMVRERVLVIQKEMTQKIDIVIEGRDICTKVFPNAEVKLFLDASLESRAKRRYEQNLKMGIECTYEEIYENIAIRSKLDAEREVAPLVVAEDATYIDTSDMSIDEVMAEVLKEINTKIN